MNRLVLMLLILMLTSCGGGGGDAPASGATPEPAPAPDSAPVGLTIQGRITGASAGMVVVLDCMNPLSAPNQWGCLIPMVGYIQQATATVGADGNYSFTQVEQAYRSGDWIPIPVGYRWKVIPYSCSLYSYGNVYMLPLPPTPYGCTPTERVFDLTASVTGIDFFMWATP